ncbi:MAG: START-like domain-containing protein [Candidatus Cloacimonetes bacterium]|nr:START-like domain-containing protein [Bacteroidales bacterium]MDD3098151.1 START-like domain-containing protein [Candidatus Cloacimonadota bacterium]MDD2814077.1 START-like domain-containing protein [Bacteroidales bacterium]MDD3579016.1 START-like domain-containing protein [Candidatus Cloacimonadota bacterium]MDD3872455.1 START-like domain-containing protein [Bacteroidales bacterium]
MKHKFEMEYLINASLKVLFTRLSTPSGLSEWFADDVNLENNILTFFWEKSQQQAEILFIKDNKAVRLKWLDDEDPKTYFEFRLNREELTGDVSLTITDFARKDEIEDARELWDTQINQLKTLLGS